MRRALDEKLNESRGVSGLIPLVEKLELSTYGNGLAQDVAVLEQGARPVRPGGYSRPPRGAVCDPARYLHGKRLAFFNSLHAAVVVADPALPGYPKACHRVAPDDEVAVARELIGCGMCTLILASMVARDVYGHPLVGGLFGAPHKETDRLINDRRPLNWGERRMAWVRLPNGVLLIQLVVAPDERVVGDGDDISNFFPSLRHHPDWVSRNAVGGGARWYALH